jgi:hypothetical protein
MFKHAASSLWRRLTSRRRATQQPVGAGTIEDERRVWVRHPADLHTTVAAAADDAGFAARIRDISRGGIKLLTEQAFDPGTLLTVGLPGGDTVPELTVLACVVRCEALGPKLWVLGCTFSQEMSAADLHAFGAARTRPAQPDLRAWERYPCNVQAACQTVSAPEEEPWSARVLDVSPAGMALAADRVVDTGALLSVVLRGPHSGEPLTILACVVHVGQRPEGGCILGCNFIRELSDADLQQLL